MNEYLNHMFQAFSKVGSRHYFTETLQNLNEISEDPELDIQSTEATFTSELYRHWRNIMEEQGNRELYDGIAIDLDITKRAWHPRIVGNERGFRPDIVLHQSQAIMNEQFQIIYGEVKTTFNPNVDKDIRKIANALSLLHFQNGVFISVNSNIDELKDSIYSSITSVNQLLIELQFNIDWSNVYLMHANQHQDNHTITPFNEIYNGKRRSSSK